LSLAEFAKWYEEDGALSITFLSNKNLSRKTFVGKLRQFHGFVDRDRLGNHFYKKPTSDRLNFWVVPEGADRFNLHYHGYILIPKDDRYSHVNEVILKYEKLWRHICPGGSLRIRKLYQLSAVSGRPMKDWSGYINKENQWDSDGAVWSLQEFLPVGR
jgi:hypothetical protein